MMRPATTALEIAAPNITTTNWRRGLPCLAGRGVTLRELRVSDAEALHAQLSTEEVARFISPPPTTVEGFRRFIAWSLQQRALAGYVCFGIIPAGHESPIGLIQIRPLETGFGTAEWGFAIGSAHWGTGVFHPAAGLALEFAFAVLGVRRMEARAAVDNRRGAGALIKLGASQEALLRGSLLVRGEALDQVLWTIHGTDWLFGRILGHADLH